MDLLRAGAAPMRVLALMDAGQRQCATASADGMGRGRTEADLATAIGAAAIHVGAWSDGRLVGFARAITDGVYRSFIEDVVVDESLRGQRIGRRLVRELLERCADVDVVALDCRSELVSFYVELGFTPRREYSDRDHASATG